MVGGRGLVLCGGVGLVVHDFFSSSLLAGLKLAVTVFYGGA